MWTESRNDEESSSVQRRKECSGKTYTVSKATKMCETRIVPEGIMKGVVGGEKEEGLL